MSIRLEFSGWFQCRLATDPDPTDEPRGVSGTTFALAGEPDFDNVIRLNDPPAGTARVAGPAIGVRVGRVIVNGRPAREPHPLSGARVDLLNEPRFYSRNRVLGDPGHEPVHPIDLRISGRGATLRRRDPLDHRRPTASPWDVAPEHLARHAPHGVVAAPPEMIAATKVRTPRAYVRKRLAQLLAAHLRERAPIARLALEKRIRELRCTLETPGDRRLIGLAMCQEFDIDLAGPARVSASDAPLRGILVSRPWRLRFSFGVWDADALCGFMMGTLDLPVSGHRAG